MSRWRAWRILCVLILMVAARVTSAQTPIQYFYDELGRLIAVVEPGGDSAVYHYDAVGNVLSIDRHASSQVSIISVSPSSGPAGTTVTIAGTGFSATPSQDTVTFNGTTATISAATTTTLTVTVPVGATTGTIAVTAPAGSATSGSAFVVGAGVSGPTITGLSPAVAVPGTAVTVTGTDFDTEIANNRTAFNTTVAGVTAATATTLTTSVAPNTGSGHVTVRTPRGTAISTADLIVPPAPYTAADVAVSGRLPFATATTVTVSTANKIGLMLFDGTAGQRVSLRGTNGITGQILGCDVNVSIQHVDNTVLAPATCMEGEGFIDVTVLPSSGTYTIVVDPVGAATGGVTLTLYTVPADVSGTITAGGSAVTLTTTTPGQNGSVTFAAVAGQRISLTMASGIGGFGTCTVVTITKPDGNSLFTNSCVTVQGGFVEPLTIPTTGTYTIAMNPPGSVTGAMTLTLYDVPADSTGTIVAGGSSATITIATPGQNGSVTFTAVAAQRISLNMASSIGGFTCTAVTIKKPDTTTLVSSPCVTVQGGFIEPVTIPTSGTYTIAINPEGTTTGAMTLTLYDVPADANGTIVAGGSAQTVTIGTPGQNASLTFTGAAAERISLNMTNVTIGGFTCTVVTIKKPDGSPLASNGCVTTQGAFIDVQTLTVGGTYTIAIDPPGNTTGSMTLTLYDVADVTGSVTVNGSGLPVTLSVPGQNADVTVAGTTGQSIRIPVTTPGASACATVRLLRADNVTSVGSIFSCGGTITLPSTTLPATETYHVILDLPSAATGNYAISVVSP
jgi:YD repeat-containing protein